MFIRGGAPEDAKTTLDGFSAGYPYHFLGLSSTIPITLLEGITVYPGGFPIEFGNYLGGIIEIHTTKPERFASKVGASLKVFF